LRFRWAGLGIAWLVCIGGWYYVAKKPDVYEAQARFFLDTASMLEPVLENQIIATDPEEQLAFIRENLFGRTQLEAVSRTVGLAGCTNHRHGCGYGCGYDVICHVSRLIADVPTGMGTVEYTGRLDQRHFFCRLRHLGPDSDESHRPYRPPACVPCVVGVKRLGDSRFWPDSFGHRDGELLAFYTRHRLCRYLYARSQSDYGLGA
jgi:hypothetical protein